MSGPTSRRLPSLRNWVPVLPGALGLMGLYAVSRYHFLLFHCLAEAFSIVIAVAVFAIFWNTRQFIENGTYSVIGLGCLFAGFLDLIYIFAYPGMSVFPGADGNLALQAKTVAQWYVSLSCVGAFLFLRRKLNQNLALLVYSGLFALAIAAIFYWQVFPDCYLEGVGITPFARIGLVISCSAYLVALALLTANRREFDRRVFALIAGILSVFFVQDLACAVATELDGFARTVAHLCQVVALYLVYKAFVEVGLRQPYDLLFRSQQQSMESLQIVFEDLKHAQETLKQAHEEQLRRHRTELAHVARLSMMGEIAASLAHELNQPLHAVNNYASGSLIRLLRLPERDPELVAALEQIGAEAKRAAGIIRRVRGFVEKRELQFSEVLVNSLVQEVVFLAKSEIEQRCVKVILDLSDALPAVFGDPILIEQVIMNLVRNGLEAMDDTPERDRLLCIRTLPNGDEMIQVEVCDRGSGIDRQDLEKVFEPFFTTKPEGMGMGLTISRNIVQAHGGRLWLSANEDGGCTFHFTLPAGKRG